jgi:hypothetical protein
MADVPSGPSLDSTPHYANKKNTHRDRWLDREWFTAWRQRSPDLNPLWEHLKSLMYATHVGKDEELHHRILDICQTIPTSPVHDETCWGLHLISRTFWTLMTNILSFSYNSHIQHFQTYDYRFFFLIWYVELVPKFCSHISLTICIWNNYIYFEVFAHNKGTLNLLAVI